MSRRKKGGRYTPPKHRRCHMRGCTALALYQLTPKDAPNADPVHLCEDHFKSIVTTKLDSQLLNSIQDALSSPD